MPEVPCGDSACRDFPLSLGSVGVMMGFLVQNVVTDTRNVRFCYGEGSVAFLPAKETIMPHFMGNHMGGGSFDLLDEHRD